MTPRDPLLLFAFCILPWFSIAQNRNTPLTTPNFFGYRMGIAYPFFNAGDEAYKFSNKSFNYGVHGGIEFGHFFGEIFSVALSPSLMYSKYSNTDYHYELRMRDPDFFILERNGIYRYNHLSLFLPLVLAVRMDKKMELGVSAFMVKPLTDREYIENTETRYLFLMPNGSYGSFNPPQVDEVKTESNKNTHTYSRKGISGRLSWLLKAEHWEHKRLDIEYYHSLTKANLGVYEKWIVVSFKNVFYK